MLLNIDRARQIMLREGLDALVAVVPHNVYYTSGHWCGMMDARWEAIYFSVLPRDENRPATLVLPSLGALNLTDSPTWMPNRISVTMPWAASTDAERPAPAFPIPHLPRREGVTLAANDLRKQELIGAMEGATAPNSAWALKRALNDAGAIHGKVGFDDYRVAWWAQSVGMKAEFVPSGHLFQEIRLIKTADEIALLRVAARINEEALIAAAQTISERQDPQRVQMAYMTEMARQGGQGVFLATALGQMPFDTFRPGIPVMLDAFGRYKQYHGDVGRTAVIGKPTQEVIDRTGAITEAWQAAFANIGPGLRYSDIRRIITNSVRAAGLGELGFCNPHNLGLTHTDDPAPDGAPPGVKGDIKLEAGMVVNVDMPFEELGWGSVHSEDTVLVNENGCEALTSNTGSLIVIE
jgi:Xaa-Pro aminopeptidase